MHVREEINFLHRFQQVNENGLLSFLTEIAVFFSIPFPLDYPAIAPLYSDVDIRTRGNVWFR